MVELRKEQKGRTGKREVDRGSHYRADRAPELWSSIRSEGKF